MYAKLSYIVDPGNTANAVLADIVDLLQGETNVANLPGIGGIDTGNSFIDTSYKTVSYTLFDDVSVSEKVFRIPVHDDSTQYFYVRFTTNGARIRIQLYETWDNVSHTGTQNTLITSSNDDWITVSASPGTDSTTIYITATNRHFIARSEFDGGSIQRFNGFIQYDRIEAWDTPAAGFKPVILIYESRFATSSIKHLNFKDSSGAVKTADTQNLYLNTRYGNIQRDPITTLLGDSSATSRGLDASGNSVHNMYEVGCSYISNTGRFMTGPFIDMYLSTYQNGAFGDTVTIGADVYQIWEVNTDARMAIRKG